jgi:pre-60S factor REI1
MVELPAFSEDQYDAQAKSQVISRTQKDSEEQAAEVESDSMSEDLPEAEDDISEKIPLTQCLFCNLDSPTLDANIDHLSSLHGLFIPSPDQVSDMESLLGYLAVIIFEYNECLYCGLGKGTVDGVQTHMRDKGHCMINMNAESELLDFWELADSGDEGENETGDRAKSAAVKVSDTEMRLPSGVVINSRSDATQLRARPGLAQSRSKSSQHRIKRDEMRALAAGEDQEMADANQSGPSRSNDRHVAVRGEMGLIGVSESQRRALQITAKKMKRREAIAKAAQRHAAEQEPAKAVYYKVGDYEDLEDMV